MTMSKADKAAAAARREAKAAAKLAGQGGAPVAPTAPPAAPAVKVAKKGPTVTIMCKTPNGIQMRLHRMEEKPVQGPGGAVNMEKVAVQIGESVTINGYAAPAGKNPWHKQPVEGGYALTKNVSKEFWEAWLKQNHDLDLVRNNLIFAADDRDAALDQAQEQEGVWDGMQPLLPTELGKDPRNPKPTNKAVKGVETAERG